MWYGASGCERCELSRSKVRRRWKSGAMVSLAGHIQKVDPPQGSVIYTIGVLESRIGGSTFWILPGVWVGGEASGFQIQQRKLQ